MASFDFTKLVAFLQALVDAFMALMEKLGFSFDFSGNNDEPTTV